MTPEQEQRLWIETMERGRQLQAIEENRPASVIPVAVLVLALAVFLGILPLALLAGVVWAVWRWGPW